VFYVEPLESPASSEITYQDGAQGAPETAMTLGSLPIGARLVIRCRKDWRDATIVSCSVEKTTLSVGSPSGRTYRLRKPSDSLVVLDGFIFVLGEGAWRLGLVKYDIRW
jgi:hypothetical protein